MREAAIAAVPNPPPRHRFQGRLPMSNVEKREETFAQLLGARGAALDATLPSVAFVVGWLLTDRSVGWAALIAVATAVVVGAIRLVRGDKIRAVLVGAFVV